MQFLLLRLEVFSTRRDIVADPVRKRNILMALAGSCFKGYFRSDSQSVTGD
jgi:hypothetical protein